MKVKGLIKALSQMPQDAEVGHIWDGALRTSIEFVWLAKNGIVATCDFDKPVYSDSDRPKDAPTEKENSNWCSPEKVED